MVKKGEKEAARSALYRHYRPRSLADVIGQSHVTEVLRRSLEQGKIAHAYLLTGPRGVGKTSIARILAHEINQLPYTGEETHLDIIEIDAASNNGVDDVRDLRDKVRLAPIAAAKKVYIIDEVHMLSKPAFNALLKTLEEPPAHIVFILATTDLHKVPATIISRTQHFSFRTISPSDVATHLKKIANTEKIKISDDALDAIAYRGDGSFRDSISLLDQLSSFAEDEDGITIELIESTLGLAPTNAVKGLLSAVASRDVAAVISQLDELEKNGVQSTVLADQLIQAVRVQLIDSPYLVSLLDALLTVSGSPQPQLKLLTVLVGAIKPKSAAATATRPSITIQAPLPKTTKSTTTKTKVASTHDPAPEQAELPDTPAVSKPSKRRGSPRKINLNWEQLVEYTKTNMVALHSVLGKCAYRLDGDTLTIYAGLKFNKKKLDEAKYLTQLHNALFAIGVKDVTIVTLPHSQPPIDEQLAKVAAMMGGGQEVTLDETIE